MVKASPFALVSVGAADAFRRSPGCYVREALPGKVLEAGGGGVVVEIAHDDDARMRLQRADGVDSCRQATRDSHAEASCGCLSASPARRMEHEDMQRKQAVGELAEHCRGGAECRAADIKDVSSGAHPRHGVYSKAITRVYTEGGGLIHQCHIYASLVGRVGHDILVSGSAEQ